MLIGQEVKLKDLFEEAISLIQANEKLEHAEHLLNILIDTKEHTPAYFYLGTVYHRQEKLGLALALYKYTICRDDTFIQAYNNAAVIYKKQLKNELAIEYIEEGVKILNSPHVKEKYDDDIFNEMMGDFYVNLGSMYVANGTPTKAIELLDKALSFNDSTLAKWNRALAYLEIGEWEKGFSDYHEGERYAVRKSKNYHHDKETPLWDGTPGQTVAIFGEQGIGDEIMFSSVIPDAMKDIKIVLDAHPRLADMFRDSFPDIPIYATRKDAGVWHRLHKIDACMPIGNLAAHYRKKDEDFPKVPYLKANQKLIEKVKLRFQTLKPNVPCIGFSWTGGTKGTNRRHRTIDLELWQDIFKLDANFICLGYEPETQQDIDKFNESHNTNLVFWRDIIDDYDMTAALLTQLDLVVCAPQSVIHLAGALGVKGIQLCPVKILWQAGKYGCDMPWYKSITNIWQEESDQWVPVMKKAFDMIEGIINVNK